MPRPTGSPTVTRDLRTHLIVHPGPCTSCPAMPVIGRRSYASYAMIAVAPVTGCIDDGLETFQ